MTSTFAAIFEEFEEELVAVIALVEASADPKLGRPKVRVAGANAAILLLAATFEEFIRELTRAFAKSVVESCKSYDKLPPKLASVAWKRTMDTLARIHLNPRTEVFSKESIFSDALTKFTVAYEFCRGDIRQDIYQDLIHNENNMRPQEINSLFKLSGLSNVCHVSCTDGHLLEFLNETEQGKAHGKFIEKLEEFFERRNQVAHSISAMRSSGPDQILVDLELLRKFGFALCRALESNAPSPYKPP